MADLSREFVASVATSFQSHNIPCVLWGHCLLQALVIPFISVDFVVPDDCLQAASDILAGLDGITKCNDEVACPTSNSKRRTPPPWFHLHLGNSEDTFALYPQSDTLWFLPKLQTDLLAQPKTALGSPCFTLASDQVTLPPSRPGRGRGYFQGITEPVLVPKPHVYLEAQLRLYARDFGQLKGAFTLAMINYVQMYVDDDGLLDSDKLPDPLKGLYKELRYGDLPLRQWARELQMALGVPTESDDDSS